MSNELWMPAFNTIVLKTAMRPLWQRCALAHGIAHCALGHESDQPKEETQADRYASLYLIDPAEFAQVIKWADDMGQVAQELGVTHRLLAAYLARLVY